VERKSAVGGYRWERKGSGSWELRSLGLRTWADFRSTHFREWNDQLHCRGVEVLSAKLAKVAGENTLAFPDRKLFCGKELGRSLAPGVAEKNGEV
jgi:hypothetical protein